VILPLHCTIASVGVSLTVNRTPEEGTGFEAIATSYRCRTPSVWVGSGIVAGNTNEPYLVLITLARPKVWP